MRLYHARKLLHARLEEEFNYREGFFSRQRITI
jgi:hypothetical protein